MKKAPRKVKTRKSHTSPRLGCTCSESDHLGCAACSQMGCGCQGGENYNTNTPFLGHGEAEMGCGCCSKMGCFTYQGDHDLSGAGPVAEQQTAERPSMWTPEAIVEAVERGLTFTIPFVDKGPFTPNAYWVGNFQMNADGLTVGPKYTPEISLHGDWIRVTTFFNPYVFPREVWESEPNENGVVPIHLEIPPNSIDWVSLNERRRARARR